MPKPLFRTGCLLAIGLLLAACGGGGDRASLAAQACDAATRERLEGKDYQLDLTVLAGSMKDKPDGSQLLTAEVVVEPGLATEAKQIIECSVRFAQGKNEPDVIGFVFNW